MLDFTWITQDNKTYISRISFCSYELFSFNFEWISMCLKKIKKIECCLIYLLTGLNSILIIEPVGSPKVLPAAEFIVV
jgi:hypothetical protein